MQAHGLDYNSATLFQGPLSCHQKLDDQAEQLLPGWPSRYTGERVWTGSEMLQQQDKWTILLSEQDHTSIVKALQFFQSEPKLLFKCLSTTMIVQSAANS